MKKIKTIFDRDWDGTRAVVNKYIDGFDPSVLSGAKATEKLDGTNVRATIRKGTCLSLPLSRKKKKSTNLAQNI